MFLLLVSSAPHACHLIRLGTAKFSRKRQGCWLLSFLATGMRGDHIVSVLSEHVFSARPRPHSSMSTVVGLSDFFSAKSNVRTENPSERCEVALTSI